MPSYHMTVLFKLIESVSVCYQRTLVADIQML